MQTGQAAEQEALLLKCPGRSRGEEPVVSSWQERDRSQTNILEDNPQPECKSDNKTGNTSEYSKMVENELWHPASPGKGIDPCAVGGESKVFHYQMKGAYYRYFAEFAVGNDRKGADENSLVAYRAASDHAMVDQTPTNLNRLGLALTFSFFYYEIVN